jgi:inner membrane protein
MDTLTHALSGALLARATGPRRPPPEALGLRQRTVIGFLAAAFPDIDFVLRFFGDTLTYLNWHRGVTHSIILLPMWALLLAFMLAALSRGRYGWRAYFGVCALGIGIHILGDVITTYGTKIFAPFWDVKVALPTTFIIDPYFTFIIIVGLLASVRLDPRRGATAGLVALAAYVSMQGLFHLQAVGIGERYAAAQGFHAPAVQALPQPFSPFNWKIVVQEGERYDIAHVNILARTPPPPAAPDDVFPLRVMAHYRPPGDLAWYRLRHFGDAEPKQALARLAWQQNEFAGFRRFAEMPVVYRVERDTLRQCVWFTDLRFVIPTLTPPFRFGMCRYAEAAEWQLHRMPMDGRTRPGQELIPPSHAQSPRPVQTLR